MRQFLRAIVSFLGSYYHRLCATRLVWWHIRNREARRRYQEFPATLSSREAALVRELQAHGIAIAPVSDFFPPEVFQELRNYVAARWSSPEVRRAAEAQQRALAGAAEKPKGQKKIFLVNLWPGDAVLDITHPFIRFSLSAPVLRIVNAYLRMFTKFRAWRLEATIPMPGEAGARASQRWHRDEEDQRLVKTFLYLNDVELDSGPFMYVEHSQEGARLSKLFPRVPPRGSLKMPPDEDRFIPKEEVRVCAGKAGTLIFCDTTGLHKGGFAEQQHRLMYTSVYTSSASPWPIRYAYPAGLHPVNTAPAVRFALENNPHQREPRFYR